MQQSSLRSKLAAILHFSDQGIHGGSIRASCPLELANEYLCAGVL
jgi:hypothetical protein